MRSPSQLCRTLESPVSGSQMAMAELVVPKSIPRISTSFTACSLIWGLAVCFPVLGKR